MAEQAQGNFQAVTLVQAPPTGPCVPGLPNQQVASTGMVYTCQNGTWQPISGGSGPIYSAANNPLPDVTTVGIGSRAFVSDSILSTFQAPYKGNGTMFLPVYSDGTVWRIG
jgi:hypothetical protein